MRYLLVLFLVGCGNQCDLTVGPACVTGRFGSPILEATDVRAVIDALNRFPEFERYGQENGLDIYFEPYRGDGLCGWFVPGNREVYVRWIDRCSSIQTLVHEELHLIDYLNGRSGHGNQEFFLSRDALEFTLIDCEA
jgi:hypothetical protein